MVWLRKCSTSAFERWEKKVISKCVCYSHDVAQIHFVLMHSANHRARFEVGGRYGASSTIIAASGDRNTKSVICGRQNGESRLKTTAGWNGWRSRVRKCKTYMLVRAASAGWRSPIGRQYWRSKWRIAVGRCCPRWRLKALLRLPFGLDFRRLHIFRIICRWCAFGCSGHSLKDVIDWTVTPPPILLLGNDFFFLIGPGMIIAPCFIPTKTWKYKIEINWRFFS